jgi:glycosyltransferase involved in cell wall biosynthesis
MSISISATIICKDSAESIGLALDSLAWCDDIVVVDSGSTDGTLEIVRGHKSKPRVIERAWAGFNPQREFSAGECKHEWVLMLDADEECSEELAKELQSLSEEGLAKTALMKMPRKNFVAKRYVRCWSPDFQTRFVHRGRVEWDKRSLPEIRTAKAGFGEGKLKGVILHNRMRPYRESDFADPRQIGYAHELAGHMAQKGLRAGFLNLWFRPKLTFLKYYFLRGSFLDGRFGLVIAYKTTMGVMLKYSVLYGNELGKDERQKTSLNTEQTDGP